MRPFLSVLLLCGISLLPTLGAAAVRESRGMLQGIHGDKNVVPGGCRACHRGMSMAISGEERICLDCHGSPLARATMESRGLLKEGGGGTLKDIDAVLRKPYRHPVMTVRGVHRSKEALPEETASAPRHSECVDCHEPHAVEKGRPFRGIPGRRVGNFVAEVEKEHELCYRCHSESPNLPGYATNKRAEFRTTNPSFHPVEGEGRSTFVVSLKEPYVGRKQRPGDVSTITCSDCHGNDDPAGPKGPHGSNYRGLLTLYYEMEDARPESEAAYALCYKCHSRSSILGNESFPYHAQHVEGNRASGRRGTSCFTCHDAHGSPRNPYLIRFNEEIVRPSAEGKIEFRSQGVSTRHGSCQLNCHGVEHSPHTY